MKFKRQYINLRGAKIWSSNAKPLLPFLSSLSWRSSLSIGAKKLESPVLLLHGGMSQSEGFDRRLSPAVKGFNVYSFDRAGHGRSPDQHGSFHFEFQMQECIAYIEDIIKEPAHLIGFSDGGIITLLVAINRPDLIKSATLVGANYNTDTGIPAPDVWEPTEEDRRKYAHFSPDPAHTLVEKIKKMVHIWHTEPNMTKEELRSIKCPTLVIAGDDDLQSIKHTNEIYESIENSRLAIIPGASHSVDKDQPELLCKIIREFLLDTSYPVTAAPVRRKNREVQ